MCPWSSLPPRRLARLLNLTDAAGRAWPLTMPGMLPGGYGAPGVMKAFSSASQSAVT